MNSSCKINIPMVSVIVPVRNCKAYIDEAIRSIVSQSYADFELIVVDDGSDDDDYSRLRSLDSRIRVVRLEGYGVSRARNVGMSLASGKYIAFLDADDVWFPGKLCAQVQYFEKHPDVGVVFGGFKRWESDDKGEFKPAEELMNEVLNDGEYNPGRSGWIYLRLLGGLLVGMNTAVIRRSIYLSVGGFNESMRQAEDYDFWLKTSRITEMHALAGVVALYRIHSASAMHRLQHECALASLLHSAQNRWGLAQPDGQMMSAKTFSQRLGSVYFDHGYSHFWRGDLFFARKSFGQSLRRGYRTWRSIIYFFVASLSMKSKFLRSRFAMKNHE